MHHYSFFFDVRIGSIQINFAWGGKFIKKLTMMDNFCTNGRPYNQSSIKMYMQLTVILISINSHDSR